MSNNLETAMELYFRWQRSDPRPAPQDYLLEHGDYADYLRPLLLGDVDGPDDSGDSASAPIDADAAERVEPAQSEPTQRTLGEYHLQREIGRGGMGVVYQAWQGSLDRHVALKVLIPQLTHDPSTLVRFRREATTAAGLQHPGIAQVLEFGNVGDTYFLAMQLIPGTSLESILHRMASEAWRESDGAQVQRTIVAAAESGVADAATETSGAGMTWSGGYVQTMVRLIIQVAETLDYAHEQGVIHRDVKPSNILVRADGRAVLVDFGLARAEGVSSLTMTGDFAGSPFYVSPEQGARKSSELDRRTDLFSLGVTLYEALTLQRPFTGDTPHQVVERILKDEPVAPDRHNQSLSADLVAIVLKSIEKDRSRRYQTGGEFAADLRAYLEYRPISARYPTSLTRVGRWVRREPLKTALGSVVLVALVLITYVWASQAATHAGEIELRKRAVESELIEGWFDTQSPSTVATAIAHFEAALALDPGNPRAIFGGVYATQVLRTDPLAFLEKHAVPGREPRVIERIRASLGGGPTPRPALSNPDELSGLSPLEYYVMAVSHLPKSGDAQADRAFADCQLLFEAAIYSSSTPRFEHFLQLSYVASRLADKHRARLCADALLTHWPDIPLAHAVAGVALSYTDRPRAIACLEYAVAQRPDLFYGFRNLALTLSADGQLERAEAAASTAARFNPESGEVQSILSMVLCKQAVKLDEKDPRYRELLARSVEHGRRAVKLAPRDHIALGQLAASIERLGGVDEAFELIQRVVEMAPNFAKGHRGLIGLARILRNTAAQREEHIRWVKVNPNGPTAHREWAEFLLLHGQGRADLDLALAAARRADRLTQGRDPFILVTLGEVLQRRGETEFLPQILARAEQRLPEDPKLRKDVEARIAALRGR